MIQKETAFATLVVSIAFATNIELQTGWTTTKVTSILKHQLWPQLWNVYLTFVLRFLLGPLQVYLRGPGLRALLTSIASFGTITPYEWLCAHGSLRVWALENIEENVDLPDVPRIVEFLIVGALKLAVDFLLILGLTLGRFFIIHKAIMELFKPALPPSLNGALLNMKPSTEMGFFLDNLEATVTEIDWHPWLLQHLLQGLTQIAIVIILNLVTTHLQVKIAAIVDREVIYGQTSPTPQRSVRASHCIPVYLFAEPRSSSE
ncbi:Uu.00g125380.m01.CDS01 [Anthostomella pinea]|uniref:Uu.00g125380.m01.CDS01 n=1 Tax=Anthostomella pinea TaxID=933095 RepID=A0AAI8YHP2_9PEZI|nr:Uu.00g125380.m01.CDS01 [Anthostomella pinea]